MQQRDFPATEQCGVIEDGNPQARCAELIGADQRWLRFGDRSCDRRA